MKYKIPEKDVYMNWSKPVPPYVHNTGSTELLKKSVFYTNSVGSKITIFKNAILGYFMARRKML